jgi:hypothetical protein
VLPPVQESAQGRQQPQERVGKVDPDGVLHALDITIAFGVLVDVHLKKNYVSLDAAWLLYGFESPKLTLPKTPKTAIQRMKRMKSQTGAKMPAMRRMNGTR